MMKHCCRNQLIQASGFILVLGTWLFAACVMASEQPQALVDNLNQPFDLAPYIEYIEDANHTITEQEIQTDKYAHQWQAINEKYFIAYNFKSRYWIRFTIQWNREIEATGILAINNLPGLVSHVTLFIPSKLTPSKLIASTLTPTGAAAYRTEKFGHLEPYNSRELREQRYGVHIDLIPHTPITVLGLVDNRFAIPTVLPISLVSEKAFVELNNRVLGILISFYAIMGSLLLYNSCLYITLRQPVYGLYVLFLLGTVAMCANIDGSSARWIMPNSPLLNYFLSNINAIIVGLVYLCFVVQALDKIKFWPGFNNIFIALLSLGFLAIGIDIFSQDTYLANIFSQSYSGMMMPVVLILIIMAMYNRVATAGYLLIAEIMIITGGTIFMLMMQGIFPVNELSLWAIHWGSATEALLLSLAVAARTNIIIQEKLKAQELAYLNERKALAALETATQVKNQFLTTVSHELRTPLNSIIGFSNVLLDDQQIKGAHRDYTQTILNNGKQLLTVVNDVLNLSLIDSNRLSITQRVVDLPGLIKGLEVKYRLTTQKKGIIFDINLDKQLPQLIKIDDEHLTQILKQLLNNAFKFTHRGCVTLHVTALGSSDSESHQSSLLFTLTDTGIGIPSDKLTKVFEPFTQADSSNTRRYSGTGVGLYIAKSVTEKMGGTLSVESTVGVGTRFDLVVHYSNDEKKLVVEQIKSASIFEKSALYGRVLYAEDNLDNQQLVQLLLTATGAEVTLAENGRAAIEAVNNADKPFDLVLMDLQMPVMDGYEATAILKRTGCRSPIVACSASAIAEIEATSEVMFDGYLGKPINKLQLYALLTKYLVLNEQA